MHTTIWHTTKAREYFVWECYFFINLSAVVKEEFFIFQSAKSSRRALRHREIRSPPHSPGHKFAGKVNEQMKLISKWNSKNEQKMRENILG